VAWVDITTATAEYGTDDGAVVQPRAERSAYVCENSLAIRRPQGKPMVPGHTYAVWLKNAVTPSGVRVRRSKNFDAILGDSAPSSGPLANVYGAFAPLRDYFNARAIDPTTVIDATVITVRDIRQDMAAIAQAVESLPAPETEQWVKCGGDAVSPCPQAEGDRACGPGGSNYDEYHALISLPIFQRGSPPYLTEGDGGDIQWTPVRQERVCLALTVPNGSPPPAQGWPLVIYAHGTGGSFRGHVDPTVAGALADAEHPIAVLGIDQVEHGTRRGGSCLKPDDLFYNFINPLVARGNPLQGAIDQISLARFAETAQVDVGDTVIRFDPDSLVFWGHSQGATEGSLMLPYADEFKGAVLSGNGAGLIDGLLGKHLPVNVAADAARALDDPALADLGAFHPLLSLIQHWEDPSDPLNYALLDARAPLPDHQPKSVFQVYGQRDNYAPPVTMASYALAGGFGLVSADASVTAPDPIGMLLASPAPLAGNITAGQATVTLGVREYLPTTDADGHFVAFDVPSANADVVHFVAMLAAHQVPQIGQ